MNDVTDAMNVLRHAMQSDPGLAISWHCNIAMACYDSMSEEFTSHEDRHTIGNEAASRFMKMLFNVDTTELIT